MSQKFALLESFSAVDDELLERSLEKPPLPWRRWGALAACCCLLLTAALLLRPELPSSEASSEASAVEDIPYNSTVTEDTDTDETNGQDWFFQPFPYTEDTDTYDTAGAMITDKAQDTDRCASPADSSTPLTLNEAQAVEPYGAYLPPGPDGFQAESIRLYQDENGGCLSALWTKGNGTYDELRWTVSPCTPDDTRRITTPDARENYDLTLYSIPLADSVPEDLREIVDHPIFLLDELTLEVVQRRTYTLNDRGDTQGPRLSFGVLCGDMIVEVTAKGVSPEWVCQQLLSLRSQ